MCVTDKRQKDGANIINIEYMSKKQNQVRQSVCSRQQCCMNMQSDGGT